ncbi:unnamed protein product, partial [Phaeothamnion confervicola]
DAPSSTKAEEDILGGALLEQISGPGAAGRIGIESASGHGLRNGVPQLAQSRVTRFLGDSGAISAHKDDEDHNIDAAAARVPLSIEGTNPMAKAFTPTRPVPPRGPPPGLTLSVNGNGGGGGGGGSPGSDELQMAAVANGAAEVVLSGFSSMALSVDGGLQMSRLGSLQAGDQPAAAGGAATAGAPPGLLAEPSPHNLASPGPGLRTFSAAVGTAVGDAAAAAAARSPMAAVDPAGGCNGSGAASHSLAQRLQAAVA